MLKLPLIDQISPPVLGGLLVLLLLLQWRFPLRRQHFNALNRIVRNFVLSAPGLFVVRLAMLPIPFSIAQWAQDRHLGLLNCLQLPFWLGALASFVLMDYAYWWWHWTNHRLPFLWRFHNVHHTDLDMDVSTAARFHLGELVFSAFFLSAAVVVIGIAPNRLITFFIAFEAATLFHHSNWRLRIGAERFLNHAIVTPRMHGIHHSIVERETNSNWGTIFCWWDKLHRTLRRDIAQNEITIGVAAYRDENELTLGRLFLLPFEKQRPWQLPNGEQPARTPRIAPELAR